MKSVIIAIVIGLAIGVAIWYGLSTKNAIDSLKFAIRVGNPKLSITDGLSLDILIDLTNPTTKGLSVSNVVATGTLNGQGAGATKPGTYSVEIKPNATSTLTLPYNIPILELLPLIGMKATDIAFGGAGVLQNIKNAIFQNKLNIKGTISSMLITIPFEQDIDLSRSL